MRLTAWGESHAGERKLNGDAFVLDQDSGFFAVADGMGEDQSGNTPARLAMDMIRKLVAGRPSSTGQRAATFDPVKFASERLGKSFSEASQHIFAHVEADVTARGFQTTATALQLVGWNAVIAHVGDSRAYLSRDGEIHQLTEDHTMVKALLQAGALTPEEAASYPYANVLARSLGKAPAVQSDSILVDVAPGDCFILCTDGLSDHVRPAELEQVTRALEPQQAVPRLVAMARERRLRDDITAVIIRVEGARTTTHAVAVPAQDKADFLRRVFLFKDLNFQEAMRVLTVVREQRFRDGEVIIQEGDTGDSFFIQAEGRAVVSQAGVKLTTIETGGHYGELGLLGGGIRSATVTALGNATVFVVDKPGFYELVARDQQLGVKLLWGFLQNLGERVKTLSSQLAAKSR